AQFFEDGNGTNTLNFSSNSTSSPDSGAAEILLLSQKLKKASFGYRDLVGQVKNIGNNTASFVRIDLTTYDKNGDVLGTDSTYATANTLKPNQKSTFQLMTSADNFKGMDHYELSLQWRNPDFTEGYVENA
ncbi:MAG: FxLYD domain-containing protein, partial [Nitrososphaeraceae archaeon]|nr:FxLYD domain-containing protein [Nitrososphaeraceae archaeon]